MFHRLLVPLDGSATAEAALPAARQLVEHLGAEISLVHVIERRPPQQVHGEAHLSHPESAARYLDELATEKLPAGCKIRKHVHSEKVGDVGKSLAQHAREWQIDLIVMAIHGAAGIRHGLFGTLAQKVLALCPVPLLLIPSPSGKATATFACRRILVPLDGDPAHEQGLAALSGLGENCGNVLMLLAVVPTWRHVRQNAAVVSRLLPGTTRELLELSPQTAHAYLQRKVSELATPKRQLSSVVERGDPASQIVKTARTFQSDLIILGTHGKTYTDAFWSGSITPQIFRQSHLPLLLVPITPEI